ncbi:MAG: ion channel protein Tsx [Gammaproteobacteria bacterium]|nr:ion channel protein Tsx [Gammaproteobacteria bacterium]
MILQTVFYRHHKMVVLLILSSFFLIVNAQADQAEEASEVIDKEVENDDKIAHFLGANFTYSNMSINYLDWTKGTNDRSGKKDFFYLELEGGANWDWGDFYFFMDFENPQKGWYDDAPDNTRFVFKPIFDIKIGDSNWNFYFHDYYLSENNFYVSNIVPGISYKYVNDSGVFFKPFIGGHYQKSTFYSGWNGYMAGWVAAYDFSIKGQNLSISQWHEYEFERDEEHYKTDDGTRIGDGASTGTNGAIAFWWKVNKKLTTGIQYRYANNKLGSHSYQTGPIYTIKYHF